MITEAREVQLKLENAWFIGYVWHDHVELTGPGGDRAQASHAAVADAIVAMRKPAGGQ